MPLDFIEETAPASIDFQPEQEEAPLTSPGIPSPPWPVQEGVEEPIAAPQLQPPGKPKEIAFPDWMRGGNTPPMSPFGTQIGSIPAMLKAEPGFLQQPAKPIPTAPSVDESPVSKVEKLFLDTTQPGIILKNLLGENVATQVARETYNQAKSVPEFFETPLGMAALGTSALGPVARTLTTGAFTADTLRSLVKHVEESYGNWGEMTDTQKARALVQGIGLGTLGALLTHGTARGIAGTVSKTALAEQEKAGKLSPATLGWERLKENIANLVGAPTGLPRPTLPPIAPPPIPHTAPAITQEQRDILPRAAEAAAEEIRKGVTDASEISKTTEVYGDVRPQPVESGREVPAEESGAGVQPQAKEGIPSAEAGQERVLLTPEGGVKMVAAAYKTPSGKVITGLQGKEFEGVTHMEAAMAAEEQGLKVDESMAGFVDSSGKFYNREDAYKAAKGQIDKELDTFAPGQLHTGKLKQLAELTPAEKAAEQTALDEALGQETTQLPVDETLKPATTGVIPNESVNKGDTIQWNPKPERAKRYGEIPVSGVVQDVIRNQEGEIGFNVWTPTKDDPTRVVRVWSDRGDVVSRQPTQMVAPSTGGVESPGTSSGAGRTPQRPKTVVEIADEIAARGIDPQASYGQFVKARDLNPEISAKEWLPIYRQSLELAKLNKQIAIARKSTPPPGATPTVSPAAEPSIQTPAPTQGISKPTTEAVTAQPAAKEPWQMTYDELVDFLNRQVVTAQGEYKLQKIYESQVGERAPSNSGELVNFLAEHYDKYPQDLRKDWTAPKPAAAPAQPFLDIAPDKWTPEYWKRIGEEGRKTVRTNLQGALEKLGSKTKITERSSAQTIFSAIAEVNKARTTEPLPPGPGAMTRGEVPQPAISQLTDALRAVQPEGEKTSIPLRERIADNWSQGKTLWERAMGKMLAVKEGLKHAQVGLRDITDAERRVSKLDADLQLSSGRSRDAGRAIRRQQPDRITRDAVALWIDTPGDPAAKQAALREVLGQLPDKTPNHIRRAIERAANLSPEARQFAESLRQYFGIREQDAIQNELFNQGLADYYTHIWQKESNMPNELRAAISNGRVNSYFQFARQRKIGMFLDGILQGKTPILDPADVVPYYNYALDRSIASRQFVRDLSDIKASDGRPAVAPVGNGKVVEKGETPDAMLIRPQAKGEMIADYRAVDHPALRKWKYVGEDTAGNPVLQFSDLVVHPEFYERVARMMDRGRLSTGPIVKGLLKAGTEVKSFKLGYLSLFHQVHVGSHALFHWTNPVRISNKPWIDAATKEINWDHPAVRQAIEQGHLKLAPDPAELANFSEGILSSGWAHKVPVIGPWSRMYSEWFFGDYIPKLKLATYENALRRNLIWYKGKATPEQISARVGDAVNNAYGELNQMFLGKFGRDPRVQRLLRGMFLAPDFGEARLRFVAKAFTKFGKEERIALATMFVTMYGTARILNILSHGDPEMHDPKRAFMVKFADHWWTMRSVVGDVAHALTRFPQFLRVRLSPLYGQALYSIFTGQDEQGLKQPLPELLAKQTAKTLVPIQFGALTRDDQKLWESFITSMGVGAYTDSPVADVNEYVREWKKKSGNPKLVAQVERAQQETAVPSDYKNLRYYLHWENIDKALEEVKALQAKGKSTEQIVQALRPMKPFTGSWQYEKAFKDSLNVPQRKIYERAQEEGKENYRRLIAVLRAARQNP